MEGINIKTEEAKIGEEISPEAKGRGEKIRDAMAELEPIYEERIMGGREVLRRIIENNKSSFSGPEERSF